jgi:hypothetical protein
VDLERCINSNRKSLDDFIELVKIGMDWGPLSEKFVLPTIKDANKILESEKKLCEKMGALDSVAEKYGDDPLAKRKWSKVVQSYNKLCEKTGYNLVAYSTYLSKDQVKTLEYVKAWEEKKQQNVFQGDVPGIPLQERYKNWSS